MFEFLLYLSAKQFNYIIFLGWFIWPKAFRVVSEMPSHKKYRTETNSEFSRTQELVAELKITNSQL